MNATVSSPLENTSGLHQSAHLLKALGARASDVWAELSPEEAARLSKAMMELDDRDDLANRAAQVFLETPSGASPRRPDVPTIWSDLSQMPLSRLSGILLGEHPQILALIITRLAPAQAAALVRRLPPEISVDTLRRVVRLGPVRPCAIDAIAGELSNRLGRGNGQDAGEGERSLARIFDELDAPAEKAFLAALDHAVPGTEGRVRALMFTYADLVRLSPAGLQTILAMADRRTLTLALKGEAGAPAEALFANMTRRAGEVLREEIEALGPVAKTEIDKARRELVALARDLIESGDIQTTAAQDNDEWVE